MTKKHLTYVLQLVNNHILIYRLYFPSCIPNVQKLSHFVKLKCSRIHCFSEASTCALREHRCFSHRQLHHHHRCWLQNPNGWHRWRAREAADLGHSGAGEIQNHHVNVRTDKTGPVFWPCGTAPSSLGVSSVSQVLQEHPRCHHCLRRDQPGIICQRETVAKRNLPELWQRL